MPTTIPVLCAKFGETEYYIATMKAGELVDKLKIPKELPDWENMTIEERFQREVNYKRVKDHIAPYLALSKDRFFGALIVDMYNCEGIRYEPLEKVAKNLPNLYGIPAKAFGFLTLTGGEVLVPLDGQHRLAAFQFAITGKDEKKRDIEGFTANLEVANDDVTLILVRHEEKRARSIFNKVNRYAKPTTKAENLITADDDIVAVITRLIANDHIGERLVNYRGNTLSKTVPYFTTLSTIYDSNVRILEFVFNKKIDTTMLPEPQTQMLYEKKIKNVWDELLMKIELFKLALSDTSESGDAKRCEIREQYLLGKPIGQQTLVIAFMRLCDTTFDDGSKLSVDKILNRLNQFNWSVENPRWQRVLMNGTRVVTGRQAALFASRFIAYLAGENLSPTEINALKENYRGQFPLEEQGQVEFPDRKFPPKNE